jgi:hypothetical protein
MKRLALAAASALSLIGAAAHATTIDTTPFWDGSTQITAFGGWATGVYGETFVAPGGALNDFTFYVNSLYGQPENVVGQVYAWSGSMFGGNGPQGAVGPALFTSAPITINPGSFVPVTVNTGNTPLVAGGHYVALLADVGDNDYSGWGLTGFFSHPGVAGDGGFNFFNNGNNLGAINSQPWDDFADFGSLAWTANFGGAPEPAEWALMLAGFGLAGATLRARKRASAAA